MRVLLCCLWWMLTIHSLVLLVWEMMLRFSFNTSIVEFETKQDAVRALKTLNDSELQGRLIYLREVYDFSSPPFIPCATLPTHLTHDAPRPSRSRIKHHHHSSHALHPISLSSLYLLEPQDREDREAPQPSRRPFVREERPRFQRDERPHFSRPTGIPKAGGPGCQIFVHNISNQLFIFIIIFL